jgi:hypothetical protein
MSSSLIRQDLGPMVVGYLLVMGSLAIGLRMVQRSGKDPAGKDAAVTDAAAPARLPKPDQPGPETGRATARARLRAIVRPEPGWRRLVIHSLATAVGGYLLLMAVLIAYYYGVGVAHGGNFVQSGFSGCAMLLGLAAPVFIALSWLTERKGWRL